MSSKKHIEILNKGVSHWNKWREDNESIKPNLSELQLSGLNLVGVNFHGANLTKANLTGSDLSKANLTGANLTEAKFKGAQLKETILSNAKLFRADLSEANLFSANLHKADLSEANLTEADLSKAHLFIANLENTNLFGAKLVEAILKGANLRRSNLEKANLRGANLIDATLNSCKLKSTDFTRSIFGFTVLSYLDMQEIIGLDTIFHSGPSSMSIENIFISEGKIPESFIRGCGVPDTFITYIPSLVGAALAIQFYSCFISYCSQDEEFAKRLHSRMRQANLRVWFAPEDMKGGQKLNEQIESAIHLNDRLLIVLSENSMKSKWVLNEIRRARMAEQKENRKKLFPISLTEFKTINEWEKINPNIDVEIAEEVRSYFIPSFTNWKNHDSFEKAFEKLYNDLKSEES